MKPFADLPSRVQRLIDLNDDGCWLFTGSLNHQGYGVLSPDLRPRIAHRFTYEVLVGSIPQGLTLDHLCRNRACVNPAHMEPVTMRENTLRGNGRSAVNARKTHCPRSHPLSGDNLYLSAEGERHCRQCRRDWGKERTARARARKARAS